MENRIEPDTLREFDFFIFLGIVNAIAGLQWFLAQRSLVAMVLLMLGVYLIVKGVSVPTGRGRRLAVAGICLPYLVAPLVLILVRSQYEGPLPVEKVTVIFAIRMYRAAVNVAFVLGIALCLPAIWDRARWLSLVVVPVVALVQYVGVTGAAYGFWKWMVGPIP